MAGEAVAGIWGGQGQRSAVKRPRDPHDPAFPFDPIRPTAPLLVGARVDLGRRAAEQLRLRQVSVGEGCTLVSPDGAGFRARLTGWTPEGATAEITERMPRPPESPLRLTLACAFLARQRMLWVCQKAAELGCTRVLPIYTEFSLGPAALEHEKAHAWQGQAVRATKQCRRAVVPEVRAAVPLAELAQDPLWETADARFYLDDQPESAALPSAATSVCLAAGPEGGWSPAERDWLRGAGARPLALGGRVLRAETAVVVGATVLQVALGDLQPREATG
jgi:16S rRNA (uracil1498-N3)-methyltransferase